MRSALSIFALLLALTVARPAVAAPLTRDLGRGLTYLRVEKVPADLPPPAPELRGALILDLRFAAADAAAARTFAAWLKFHASATSPVAILVNSETSPSLLAVFLAPPLPTGVITLGPTVPQFTPDVAVNVAPDADRRAFDALAHGTAIEDLIARKFDKTRHDEAALARQHATGGEEDEPDPLADNSKPAATTPAPAPATDLVLARAVQLHRALLALRRLP